MHPHLPLDSTMKVAERRVRSMDYKGNWVLDDLVGDINDAVSWVGSGLRIDTTPLEGARKRMEALAGLLSRSNNAASTGHGTDKDQTEGAAAAHLFDAIEKSQVEPSALDDPGFWRYVAMAHMWNFAAWRESRAFTASVSDSGNIVVPKTLGAYVDGKRSSECVPLRMYLRVRCLGGAFFADWAGAVRKGTDFWRSHILRVVPGEHPVIVRAMVQRQSDERTRLETTQVREFAKELNRKLANLVPAMLDCDAAEELVDELWQRQRP